MGRGVDCVCVRVCVGKKEKKRKRAKMMRVRVHTAALIAVLQVRCDLDHGLSGTENVIGLIRHRRHNVTYLGSEAQRLNNEDAPAVCGLRSKIRHFRAAFARPQSPGHGQPCLGRGALSPCGYLR